MENFHIIQALCRCALVDNPSNATIHQVERLKKALESQDERQHQIISQLLTPDTHVNIGKIIKSNGK